jgi:malonyl CoA-acyl carrier protein transacylase
MRRLAYAKEKGARAIALNVSAPFHSPLMQPAADAMAEALAARVDHAVGGCFGGECHRAPSAMSP